MKYLLYQNFFTFRPATRQRFVCDVGTKSFCKKTKLNFHTRYYHADVKNFSPPRYGYCTKNFSTLQAKREHESVVHMSDRPYKCDYWDKGFTPTAFLVSHKRQHHNSLKLQCEKCNATFAYLQSLKEHKGQCGKSQDDKEQYFCSQFYSCFTIKRAARLYERSTHGESPHVCEHCGNSSKYRSL